MNAVILALLLGVFALEKVQSECGVSTRPAGSWRVVGGTVAKHGAWPWQIALHYWQQGPICGGSIIGDRYILTAAHCFGADKRPSFFKIRTGDHTQHGQEGTERDYYLERIMIHEMYQKNNNEHDIALIKLRTPIQYNDYAKPVCLSSRYDEFEGHPDCWVTGWGNTQGTGDNRFLQQLQAKMVSNAECNRKFWHGGVKKGMACWGTGLKGACMGDSGGPLVCRRQQKFYQVGVVSWGSGTCKDEGASSVFTRVSHYLPWIRKKMAQ